MRIVRWIAIAAGVLLLLGVVAIGALLYYVSTESFNRMIAGRAGEMTHREVAIDGDSDIHWGRTTRVVLNQVKVGNAEWGSAPIMGSADRIEFTINLPALLHGDVVLPELTMVGPRLLLEHNGKGQSNWDFSQNPAAATAAAAASPDKRDDFPIIGRLAIHDGRLTYRDPLRGIDVTSRIDTVTGTTGGKEEVHLNGEGTFERKPFRFTVIAGSLLQLRDTREPYPLLVDAQIGETRGHIKGTMDDPVKLSGLDIELDLAGPDMAELFPIFGIPLPKTPPYKLAGHLTREENRWRFENFQGGVGDSDLAGNLALETGGRRPHLSADLVSQRLDFDDLAGFIGATPKKEKQDRRVLPDEKVDLERLRAMDMKVALTGKEVIAQKLPMDDFKATFLLDDGLVTVEPLAFGAAGGRIAGRVVLNGREKVPAVSGDLQLSQLQLAKFFSNSDFTKEMGGTFGGHVALQGHGHSIAEILGNSNGKVVLTMSGGKISSHLLERVGGDIAESLGFRLTKDTPVKIRCAVADFDLQSGDLKAKTLVLDTTDTNVTGEGHIDLGSEKLDVTLNAHPKDPSLLAARTPVLIKGTLSDPKFGIDPSQAIARGAAAAVLGALLAPLAALLPMIELGLGKDSPCHELIREAQTGN